MMMYKSTYTKPELRVTEFLLEKNFCLSNVSDAGGSTSDYGEDDENPFD